MASASPSEQWQKLDSFELIPYMYENHTSFHACVCVAVKFLFKTEHIGESKL